MFFFTEKSTRQLLKIKVMLSLLKNFSIFLVGMLITLVPMHDCIVPLCNAVLGVVLQTVGFGFKVATYSFFLGRQVKKIIHVHAQKLKF